MKCYAIRNRSLALESRPIPVPKEDEVLIQVKAIGINRADVLQVEGYYPSPDGSDIPGLEVAGILSNNRKVAAILTSGGYAEYVAVPVGHIIDIPEGLSFEKAAAIPEAIAVAELNLFSIGAIIKGQKILIHGGASGIGHLLVQIAIEFGLEVYATARNIEKLQFIKDQAHLLSFEEDFAQYITEHGKADLIIDILGGQYLSQNIKSCNVDGKIILLAAMSGRVAEVDLGAILMKNISIIGSTLRTKKPEKKATILQHAFKRFMPSIISGQITPIINNVFDFDEMHLAHLYVKQGLHTGKTIVKL